MDKVKISGGRSFKDGVAFATNRCIATAKLNEQGIVCDVRRLPDSVRNWQTFHAKCKVMPRILVVLASAWIGTDKLRNKMLLVGILSGICYALSFHVTSLLFAGMTAGILIAGLTTPLVALHAKVAPYHAAEHKAFNAYEAFGSTELEVIQEQSRYHDICGTSVIAPMFLAFTAAPFLAFCSHMNFVISLALLMEAVLWVDKLAGWHMIPIFRELNKWLQLNFTTSEPNAKQLEVAKTALDAAIATHQKFQGENHVTT